MLVVTRKCQERIDVVIAGKKIAELSVIKIRGGRVHIGLTAEREVDFRRGELADEDDKKEEALP